MSSLLNCDIIILGVFAGAGCVAAPLIISVSLIYEQSPPSDLLLMASVVQEALRLRSMGNSSSPSWKLVVFPMKMT